MEKKKKLELCKILLVYGFLIFLFTYSATAGSVATDSHFNIYNTDPTAEIINPFEGAVFKSGTIVTFLGTATDPEEGALTGASLVWTSSQNGIIGFGQTFDISTLSTGVHTITLTATDSGGLTATDSVTITISSPPPTRRPTTGGGARRAPVEIPSPLDDNRTNITEEVPIEELKEEPEKEELTIIKEEKPKPTEKPKLPIKPSPFPWLLLLLLAFPLLIPVIKALSKTKVHVPSIKRRSTKSKKPILPKPKPVIEFTKLKPKIKRPSKTKQIIRVLPEVLKDTLSEYAVKSTKQTRQLSKKIKHKSKKTHATLKDVLSASVEAAVYCLSTLFEKKKAVKKETEPEESEGVKIVEKVEGCYIPLSYLREAEEIMESLAKQEFAKQAWWKLQKKHDRFILKQVHRALHGGHRSKKLPLGHSEVRRITQSKEDFIAFETFSHTLHSLAIIHGMQAPVTKVLTEPEEYPILKQVPEEKLLVRGFSLKTRKDLEKILNTLRLGHTLCLINISELKDKEKLKKFVNRIKHTAKIVGGETVGYGEGWMMASTNKFSIQRRQK